MKQRMLWLRSFVMLCLLPCLVGGVLNGCYVQKAGNDSGGNQNEQSAQKRESTNKKGRQKARNPNAQSRRLSPYQQAFRQSKPIVIAHRGASATYPEHTLPAYEKAMKAQADFVEVDVVPTKDGRLIARHDNELSSTTDVDDREEFQDRKQPKSIDGVTMTGWFSEDFTLAEIKQLRCHERIPEKRPDNTQYDGQFQVPTLREVIKLVQEHEKQTGEKIGLYIETKHPTYFRKMGTFMNGEPIDMTPGEMVVEELVKQGFTNPDRVFIQSFEVENLLDLDQRIMPEHDVDFPLIQLIGDITKSFYLPVSSFSVPFDIVYNVSQDDFDEQKAKEIYGDLSEMISLTQETHYGYLVQQDVLKNFVSTYAAGIGPWKNNILLRERLENPVDIDGDGEKNLDKVLKKKKLPIIKAGHQAGLLVHVYTIRKEESFRVMERKKYENDKGNEQTEQEKQQEESQEQSEEASPPETSLEVVTAKEELMRLLRRGADGVFTDHPEFGVQVRNQFWDEKNTKRSGANSTK